MSIVTGGLYHALDQIGERNLYSVLTKEMLVGYAYPALVYSCAGPVRYERTLLKL